ncbi:hypothetical protein JYU34_020686 [Plutella xylostella]|uniref:Uncharacterized protein n=1 Tax=Plutella xylostella TaxID=51655 RepID=A0ABQ7PUU2_PLUXY|nr:hypothetical protein JYU34_020686 [Plutella xylostella]
MLPQADRQTHRHALFSWVAAIFVRDVSSSRYTYVCDGAVLSQYTVLTVYFTYFLSMSLL